LPCLAFRPYLPNLRLCLVNACHAKTCSPVTGEENEETNDLDLLIAPVAPVRVRMGRNRPLPVGEEFAVILSKNQDM
jgi:hypothetical protein